MSVRSESVRARRQLLGRHVAGRADQRVRRRRSRSDRDAEVGDADAAVVVDQDVGRLEVAVQHALRVRGREAGAQLAGDFERPSPTAAGPTRRSSAARSSPCTSSIEKNTMPSVFADVEHAADRGMRDLPREPDLVEDRAARRRAGATDQLQRDRRLEHQIVGAPDVAHAAAAEARDHPVAAGEHVARVEDVGGRIVRSRRPGGRWSCPRRWCCRFPRELQQRFDFPEQGGIRTARLRDVRTALVGRAVEGSEENVLARSCNETITVERGSLPFRGRFRREARTGIRDQGSGIRGREGTGTAVQSRAFVWWA